MSTIEAKTVVGPRLLETLTTALYEDPIIIFREYVQNSVDAYNEVRDKFTSTSEEDFFVDIKIDRINACIVIKDNGFGVKEEDFLEKMSTIGASKKSTIKNQIGFRGIGRLSAMPLCKSLTFTNKYKGSDKIQNFKWNGEKFNELLNIGDENSSSFINELAEYSETKYKGNLDHHYFQVEIKGYQQRISELVDSSDFKPRLSMVLPLKYSPNFSYQKEIEEEYQNFMDESINTFMFVIKLDGEILYKPYTDDDVLKSGLVFWKLKYPRNTGDDKKGEDQEEKIGILWFSFNNLILSKKEEPFGILVRSKNMLMGDKYSLATAIINSKMDYVTTHRELTQMLNGVTGEMLINSKRLRDNARRDWFRIDDESTLLRHIIVDFMKRLHAYRYAASNYARGKIEPEKIKKAYTELTNFKSEKVANGMADLNKIKEEIKSRKEIFDFADEDIPNCPIPLRRFYEKLMKLLHGYFKSHSQLLEFVEIRTHIKKELNQENTDGKNSSC